MFYDDESGGDGDAMNPCLLYMKKIGLEKQNRNLICMCL